MSEIPVQEKRTTPLQKTIGLFLANGNTHGNIPTFFALLLLMSCGFGIGGGSLCYLVITTFFTRFSIYPLITGLLLLSFSINSLTFLGISRHILKKHSLPRVSEYSRHKLFINVLQIAGLMLCPLLLPVLALLDLGK